jgi:cobalt-zinc-cadmium efflux system outer membrane protein
MRLTRILALACLLAPAAPTRAEPAPPPAAALAAAVATAPALRAAHARAEAAAERRGSAGRFPDPQVEAMYSQVRPPMGGEQFPMWEVTLSQPLPKAGERAADRERAAALLSLAEADYAVMAGELAAETARALAEAEAARARAELFTRQLERTERVLTALDARLASGSSRVADRLALQTRIASVRLLVEQEARLADDALSEARGRLGLPPDAPLPAFSAPAAGEIDPESLPSLRLAAARADEARAMARMARASARPMRSVGLRFEREEERMGNTDTIGVAFMTELPFRSRGYARAEARAARAEEVAARADAEAARHRARSALARATRAERLAATSRRLADETAARLDAEYDSLVRTAGTSGGLDGETSVLLVLELLERQAETRLQIIEAEAAARLARAELWSHAPSTLFTTP